MDLNLNKYVGGQLKVDLMPRRKSTENAVTYRGEVDDIELDGRQVRVELRWVAKTTVGQYTLDTQFDLDLDFEIQQVTEDGVGNLRIISEQGEEMTFFISGDESNVKPDEIIGFPAAPVSKKQKTVGRPLARGPMIADIRINYVGGSYDLFGLLDGDKNVIGCYSSAGNHFEDQSPHNVIASKYVAQYLYEVSNQGRALNDSVTPSEIVQVASEGMSVNMPIAINVVPTSEERMPSKVNTTAYSKGSSVLAFLAIWLLPLFGMLLVQGDGPPAGEGPISIWEIWFLGVPLVAWLYKKYTSNHGQ